MYITAKAYLDEENKASRDMNFWLVEFRGKYIARELKLPRSRVSLRGWLWRLPIGTLQQLASVARLFIALACAVFTLPSLLTAIASHFIVVFDVPLLPRPFSLLTGISRGSRCSGVYRCENWRKLFAKVYQVSFYWILSLESIPPLRTRSIKLMILL